MHFTLTYSFSLAKLQNCRLHEEEEADVIEVRWEGDQWGVTLSFVWSVG